VIWRYLIEVPWIVFVAYWAIGAFKTRRTIRKESFASRYGVLLLEILGFVLLFSDAAEVVLLAGGSCNAAMRLPSSAWRSPGSGLRQRCGRATTWDSIGVLELR
jgi:hypothetical protein